MILPEEFVNRMKDYLGEEYEAFAEAFCNGGEAKGLRFSFMRFPEGKAIPESGNLKENYSEESMPEQSMQKIAECIAGNEEFAEFTDGAVPWCNGGFYVKEGSLPGKSICHEAGAFYIQEPSAMIVAALANVKPGEKVLDLCAAPGGKSTALGDALSGRGILVSNEIHPSRVKILSENIERMGIPNALVLNETPEKISSLFPEFFNCVVVDAPCSGEGMFRKEEAALREWSPENVEMCAARQREILKEAVKCVAPGGRLVYSTCTFAPAEDEENVEWFLKEYPDFSPASGNGCMRIWPHLQRGEGHFAAVLVRSGVKNEILPAREKDYKRSKNIALSREQRESFEIFAKETLTDAGREHFREVTTYSPNDQKVAALFGDNLYMEPFYFPGKGVKIERAGLHIGTFAKNRFEPSLAFARALKFDEIKNVLNLSKEQKDSAYRYLAGEQLSGIDPDLKGWTLVAYEGYALGFGKASGGVLKNHYPKGLRKNLRP